MNQPTKVWVETIKSHLELLNQVVTKLPANERLEVNDLNEILILNEKFKQGFLFMMELYGFKIETKT